MIPTFRRLGLLLLLIGLVSCRRTESSGDPSKDEPNLPKGEKIDLLFTYGSEKEEWVKAVTADFHRRQPKIASLAGSWVSCLPGRP